MPCAEALEDPVWRLPRFAPLSYFEAGGADTERFTFPVGSSTRRVTLTGTSIGIGRRSGSQGIALLRGTGHHLVLGFRCHSGAARTGPGVRQSTRGATGVAL